VSKFNLTDIEIRLITKEDANAFYELVEKNRTRLTTYFPKTLAAIRDLDSTKDFIELKTREATNKEGFWFLIIDTPGNQIIGSIVIKDPDHSVPKCELAWFIDEAKEGKGITSKAAQWVINFCFTELKMEKICTKINPANQGSRRIALKNGFVREGYLKNEYRNGHGILTDVEYYGLVKDH
jgi:RimJ/RimL family protein N-acetyltransferase